jgi:hypothetical protein
MTAWVHNHINNESSYDLILVDKRVGGSRNYKWQSADREPPAKIPAKTAVSPAYVAWADDLIGAQVYAEVTYEASVDGFVVRIILGASAADTTGGAIPPTFEVSKDKILNVYVKRDHSHREIEVYWTIKDWPD